VVLFAPTDVLTQSPLAKAFAQGTRNFLVGISPLIDIARHANSTRYPELALLTNALIWVLFYWTALITCILSFVNYEFSRARREATVTTPTIKRASGIAVFSLIFFVISPAAFTSLAGDPSFAKGITTQSRIGYALLAALCTASLGFGCGAVPIYIRFCLERWSNERNTK
jgi:hypothetical protein